MTNFLVHYDDGRYRDALVSCLAAIYDGSQDPDLLARATGTDYAELDKQYQAYMKIVRNPKSETEIRNRHEIRTGFETVMLPFEFVSDFEIRISDFGFAHSARCEVT